MSASPLPSPVKASLRQRAICGVVGLCCFVAGLLADNAASGASATGRSSADARARWSAEAQAAVESWLRSDTNELFTPSFGKFVTLQGSGYVWPPLWNIQGFDYLTLHRTCLLYTSDAADE